jgi:nickel/cobalt transporter (NicO) family protein
MIDLLAGSILLSIIHAAIPNHWIPVVMIGRAEKWSKKELIGVAVLTSFAHTLSTILLGIVIGLVGYKLSNSYHIITDVVAPLVLVFMGLIYFSLSFRHTEHEHLPTKEKLKNKSKPAIITALALSMFFSPCLEIEAYYFTAGTHGKLAIWLLSAIYLIVTVAGSILLVTLASKSIEKFKWHFLEHHEKKITGIVLIALGLLSYFIKH